MVEMHELKWNEVHKNKSICYIYVYASAWTMPLLNDWASSSFVCVYVCWCQDSKHLNAVICQTFIFCYLWAVGGNLTSSHWDAFDTFVRGQFEGNSNAKVYTCTHSHRYSTCTGRWTGWKVFSHAIPYVDTSMYCNISLLVSHIPTTIGYSYESLFRHSWYPVDEAYWLWWSPDFSTSPIIRSIFRSNFNLPNTLFMTKYQQN